MALLVIVLGPRAWKPSTRLDRGEGPPGDRHHARPGAAGPRAQPSGARHHLAHPRPLRLGSGSPPASFYDSTSSTTWTIRGSRPARRAGAGLERGRPAAVVVLRRAGPSWATRPGRLPPAGRTLDRLLHPGGHRRGIPDLCGSEAIRSVIRAYDDPVVARYCWGRFWILRQRSSRDRPVPAARGRCSTWLWLRALLALLRERAPGPQGRRASTATRGRIGWPGRRGAPGTRHVRYQCGDVMDFRGGERFDARTMSHRAHIRGGGGAPAPDRWPRPCRKAGAAVKDVDPAAGLTSVVSTTRWTACMIRPRRPLLGNRRELQALLEHVGLRHVHRQLMRRTAAVSPPSSTSRRAAAVSAADEPRPSCAPRPDPRLRPRWRESSTTLTLEVRAGEMKLSSHRGQRRGQSTAFNDHRRLPASHQRPGALRRPRTFTGSEPDQVPAPRSPPITPQAAIVSLLQLDAY